MRKLMFKKLFGENKQITKETIAKQEPKLDKILACAKYIIDNGELVDDNSFDRGIPYVKFKDDKGNTLYLSWYNSTGGVRDVFMNNRPVPTEYDREIFKMAQDRIQLLQKKYLEETINSVKGFGDE